MKIEIMSREEARRFSFAPHEGRIAVISISDCDKEFPNLSNHPMNGIVARCKLHFDDVDTGGENCITDCDARAIVSFATGNRSADKLIVHCEAGISRSAGVAAAIMKAWNGDDGPVFNNPRYMPNMTCYRKVLSALNEIS